MKGSEGNGNISRDKSGVGAAILNLILVVRELNCWEEFVRGRTRKGEKTDELEK